MKLKLARNSLFAILLRSRWWISFLLATATALVAGLALPKEHQLLSVFAALPFLVIGAIAAGRQWRGPSPARVDAMLRAVEAMPWPAFADVLEQALRADGHAVVRLRGAGPDFEAMRAGRLTLVSGRRWKAAHAGVEPLRELRAAMAARGAAAGLYVALAEPSDAGAAFAREHGIEILRGEQLVTLLARANVRLPDDQRR